MEILEKLSSIFNKHNIYVCLCVLIILGGIFLRCVFLAYNRPLWNDEAALALNILNRSNYFTPLDYSQAAPALFMYLSKITYIILNKSAISLRIIPFFASVLSLFAFWKLSEKILVKRGGILTSIFLFSFCYPLCYYAQEFKPYSLDVLIFVVTLLSYWYLDEFFGSNVKKFIYLLGCILFCWLSFSFVFAIIPVIVAMFLYKKELKIKIIPFICVLLINGMVLFLSSFNLLKNAYLHDYWSSAFINKGFLHFINLFFSNVGYVFNSYLPAIVMFLSLLCCLKHYKDERLFLLLSPLCLSLVFSFFSIYPFSTRCVLFLIPVFILLSLKFLDYIATKNIVSSKYLAVLVFVVLSIPLMLDSYSNILRKNYPVEDIANSLNIVSVEALPSDIVIISDGSEILHEYYKHFIPLQQKAIFDGKRYSDDEAYVAHLNSLNKGTYYWVFAHHPNKLQRLNSVYLWAKTKKDFKVWHDNSGNALIRFSL